MKLPLPTAGFLQALGLTLYVTLVATLMRYAEAVRLPIEQPQGIVTFLLLFVVSALISALLIFGYPIFLYLDGKGKEALKLVLWSTVWLAGFLSIAALILYL